LKTVKKMKKIREEDFLKQNVMKSLWAYNSARKKTFYKEIL